MSYHLDVLRACCLMFLHDFKNLNAVIFPWWLKVRPCIGSKDCLKVFKLNHQCIKTNAIAYLNNRDLMTRNVNYTIFPTFYFFNNNEVRNYWAVFQWHITPNENLNNFKCNLKIRATSAEELDKLEKYRR